MIIAIDGPAGAGKSTVAKQLAQKLGIYYLDTGAMYRAFTLYVLDQKVDLNNLEAIKNLLTNFELSFNEDRILVNGKDVTREIRSERVTENVSYISSLDFVRKKMVALQREIGKNKSIVAEGRDIGTVVFPDTKYKFYLDASIEERAKRRLLDEKNTSKSDFKTLVEKIRKRDLYDSTRENSPLKKAPDAIYIDTTRMNIDEVVNFIINKIKEIN
ncbi:MAG: (d)CMP kinase [Spirochaetes bacterium]|nr:MAG: (d)CMP kinase [Spirochaetota bacterium]